MSGLFVGGSAAGGELELRFEALRALPEEHQVPDISTEIAGREGRALRLSALLDLVQPASSARIVHVESADGSFTANVDLGTARAAGLVLYALGDEPLPARYGGPVRLLFADSDDCSVNVKELGRIELLETPGSHTARCDD